MTDRTLCFVLRALCMCAVGLLSFAAFGTVIRVAPGGYLGDDAQDEALADEATGEPRKSVGKRSTAIDMGDPASPYALEPDPNGSRVNLGAYGNTPWATFSPYGMKIFVK